MTFCANLFTSRAAPSASPSNISAVDLSSRQARLTWDPPPLEDRNGIIRHYQVNLRDLNNRRNFTLISEQPQYELTFLQPHHQYKVLVAAVTVAVGPSSDPYIFTTHEERKDAS